MGALTRFRFSPEFIEHFPLLVETGTGKGFSLSYGLDSGFPRVVSVEYDERLYEAAHRNFSQDERVTLRAGESPIALTRLLSEITPQTGILFWLDAHSPGSDYFGVEYDAVPDRTLRQPLAEELDAIRAARPDGNYTIIIDDWRIYEDIDCEHGLLPSKLRGLSGEERHSRFLAGFEATHEIVRLTKDAGYLVLIPKGCPARPTVIGDYTIIEQTDLARRHVMIGDAFSARVEYQRVLMMTQPLAPPDLSAKRIARGEACRFMATMAMAEHHEGAATDWFLEAAAADPLNIEHRIDFVFKSLLPRADLVTARDQAAIVTRIAPEEARGWRTLAEVERQAADADAMDKALRVAERLEPLAFDTLLLRAKLASDTGDFAVAEDVYSELYARYPDRRATLLDDRAAMLSRMGRFEDALACVNEAIALGSADPMAAWRRSDLLLALGQYAEGWQEQGKRFELERQMPGVGPAGRRFLRPLWSPQNQPERVHIHAEQGYGDVIMMARYALLVRDRGHDVRFEVKRDMVELFRHSLPGIKIVPVAADYPGAWGLEDFDSHIPSMTFPTLFQTAIDTIPWSGPYITADPARIDTYRDLRGRIGLRCAAGLQHGLWHEEYSRRKSIAGAAKTQLAETLREVDADLVSLDYGRDADLDGMMPSPLKNGVADWADTAAILANLDLVITVDTGLAHLAGALGIPTILMLHGPGVSWHWMADRDGAPWQYKSPWYPNVRILRQKRPHEWGAVIQQAAAFRDMGLIGPRPSAL